MAIGNPEPTPHVGIRGSSQELPVLQKHQALQAEVSTPNFVSALNALATTPTALGEMGARITQSAGQALAQKWGQEFGQTPHGNLLPPLTKFDEAVADSYKSQSQVTLGLQANSMFLDAQDELSKLNQITPAVISSYSANMAKGLQQIMGAAPDSIKPHLQQQFGNQLLTTTHSLTQKMNTQNKERANAESAVWRTHTADQIQELTKDGDLDKANQLHDSLIANIQQQKASGIMSPGAAETALKSAKLSYETAKSIRKGMDSHKNKGGLEAYLDEISDKKIGNLSWSESESVRDATLNYFAKQDAAQRKYQALLGSEATQEIYNNTFTDARAAYYKEQMDPIPYNNLMTQYAVYQKKYNKEQSQITPMISNPEDYRAYAGQSPKQVNSVYDILTQGNYNKAKSNGNPISYEQAEIATVNSMNTVVPKFIDESNRTFTAGNAHQVLMRMEMLDKIDENHSFKTLGVTETSKAIGHAFQNLLASSQGNPEEALNKAREIILNQGEENIKLNNVKINEYSSKHWNSSTRAFSDAINISGLENHNIQNPNEFQNDIQSRFRTYMQLTRGDTDAAKSLVAKDVSKVWGTTYVNGAPQITRLPVEKLINIPYGAVPLIQTDLEQQLIPQFEPMKKAFDSGHSLFYLRVKPRITFEDYSERKIRLSKEGLRDKTYAVDKQTIDKYEKGEQVEIEQVYKDEKLNRSFKVSVKTPPFATISSKTGQLVGGLNITIKDPESGADIKLPGYFGPTLDGPVYNPRSKWISENFKAVNGLGQTSFNELETEFNKRKERHRTAFSETFNAAKELNERNK